MTSHNMNAIGQVPTQGHRTAADRDLPRTRDPVYDEDVSCVRHLGLIARSNPVKIANPIYKEVIVRVLSQGIRQVTDLNPRGYLAKWPAGLRQGTAAVRRLLAGPRPDIHRRRWLHETAPQLVFLVYLHSVVNGKRLCDEQSVDCEHGRGRGLIDVYIRKAYTRADGKQSVQQEVVEPKARRQGCGNPLEADHSQPDGYLSRSASRLGT